MKYEQRERNQYRLRDRLGLRALKIMDASYPRTRDLHPGLSRHLGGDFKSIPSGTQRSRLVHHTNSIDHFSCSFSEHITTELQEEEEGENPTEYIQTPLLPIGPGLGMVPGWLHASVVQPVPSPERTQGHAGHTALEPGEGRQNRKQREGLCCKRA